MVKLSVIVPVYNGGKYLSICLESILGQSLTDIEIIIIDNASSDNSLEIIKKYESINKHIRVIKNQRNEGPGKARNVGMKHATGEYIAFIDCDDYIYRDMYLRMVNYMELYRLDTIICDYEIVYGNASDDINLNKDIEVGIYNQGEIINQLLSGEIEWYSWNKIYKKDFLVDNDIKFAENLCSGEDGIFVVKALLESDKIGFIPLKFYKYRKHLSSITASTDIRKIHDHNRAIKDTKIYLEKYLSLLQLDYYEVTNLIPMFIKYVKFNSFNRKFIYENYDVYCEKLCNEIPIRRVLKNNLFTVGDKIRFMLLKLKLLDRYVKVRLLTKHIKYYITGDGHH